MPLNWNITKCADPELLQSEEEWPITHALIWATMSVGLSEITEKNLEEFYARLHTWECVSGAFFQTKTQDGPVKDRFITRDDLRKRIGLYTNASKDTQAEWIKRVFRYIKENV